ncbi:MAG: acetylornithine aminotransferase [Epsilonproteobacteria bacterium]|nr:MAG: acetylornithine aminotransferase [Campylobacterota bacterium]RLA67530.1 MAG: acetylornithine aminotransferase [Campylobacterota bacterium]
MELGANSKEIREQINELFSAILMEQQKFMQIKSADPDKIDLLQRAVKDLKKFRGQELIYPYISSGRGHGPFTELIDGSIKYDLIGAMGVNLLGHSHPLYIKSQLEAATTDTMMLGNLLPYQSQLKLNQILLDSVSGTKLEHFWFSGSGSMAGDTAIKILWQKTAPKYKVITFTGAFAGRSLGMLNITQEPNYSEGIPKTFEVLTVPHYNYHDPQNSLANTLRELDKIWEKEKDDISSLMIELVQGEAGFIFAPRDFYKGIFEWAKEKGIYIFVDEVQTFARTTQLYAFQHFGLEEYVDVVTIGKALQTCGTFYTNELNPRPGLLGGTFAGPNSSLIAGEKTVKYLLEGNFYGENGRIHRLEKTFVSKLQKLELKGKISDIRGIGVMASFQVGDGSHDLTFKVLNTFFKNGLICFKGGKKPSRVRFLIPLSITEAHIEEIFKIIEDSIDEEL